MPDYKAAQSVRVRSGYESQAEGSAQEKTPVLQDAATSRESVQNRGMEAAGLGRRFSYSSKTLQNEGFHV